MGRFNEIEKKDSESDSGVSDCDHVDKMIIEHNITSDNEETNEEEVDDLTQPPSVSEQLIRKSNRERRQPNFYGREQTNLSLSQEPTTFKH